MADIKDILKNINGNLRKAQNLMFSRKFEEAYTLADAIDQDLLKAKESDPDHVQVKTYANQAAKLRKDLDSRTGKATGSAPHSTQKLPTPKKAKTEGPHSTQKLPTPPKGKASGALSSQKLPKPPKAKPMQKTSSGAASVKTEKSKAELPFGVETRIQAIHDFLEKGKLAEAVDALDTINRAFGGQFDEKNADYLEAKKLAEKARTQLEAANKASAEKKAQLEKIEQERRAFADEWRNRFSSHPQFGYNSMNVNDLFEQKANYASAVKLLEEFTAKAEPFGELDEYSQQVVDEFRKKIENFQPVFDESKGKIFAEVMNHINGRRKALDQKIEGKPSIMNEKNIEEIEEYVSQYLAIFDEGGKEFTSIHQAIGDIRNTNKDNILKRSKLVFMKPEAYSGEDRQAILDAAAELAAKAPPKGAKILKSVVTSEEWKELSRWEDYAGDKRFVVRREIYAQVASKSGSTVLLHTIYITKEKRSDNTWSKLTGNVMFSEVMDESNLE